MGSNLKHKAARRKARRVRLPVATWQRLATCLRSEEAVCKVLLVLGADSRTYASMMAYAIAQWHRGEAAQHKVFGAVWRPGTTTWLRLAHMIALVRRPMPMRTVQELRACLIECGQHEDLLRLDAAYGIPTGVAELQQLADTLLAGDQKYEWSRWDALLDAVGERTDPQSFNYIADKKAAAVIDHNSDL